MVLFGHFMDMTVFSNGTAKISAGSYIYPRKNAMKMETQRTNAVFTLDRLFVKDFPRLEDDQDTCPISTMTFRPEDIEMGNVVYVMECGHVMHTNEYVRFRQGPGVFHEGIITKPCPFCRADLLRCHTRLLPRELFRARFYHAQYEALSLDDRHEMEEAWNRHRVALQPYAEPNASTEAERRNARAHDDALATMRFRHMPELHYDARKAFQKYTSLGTIKLPSALETFCLWYRGVVVPSADPNVVLLLSVNDMRMNVLRSYRVVWNGNQGHCVEPALATWSQHEDERFGLPGAHGDVHYSISSNGSVAAKSQTIQKNNNPPNFFVKLIVFDPQCQSRYMFTQCRGIALRGKSPMFNASGSLVALCVRDVFSIRGFFFNIYSTEGTLQLVRSENVEPPDGWEACQQSLHWVGDTEVRWLVRSPNQLMLYRLDVMHDAAASIVGAIAFSHAGHIRHVEIAETEKEGMCANLKMDTGGAFMFTLNPLSMRDSTTNGEDLWNMAHRESSYLQGRYVLSIGRLHGELDIKTVRPRFMQL